MSQVVQVGEVLAGKYRVEQVLGQGGMGVVVAAMHLQLGQLVALKFLLPHMCQHAEAVVRFSREARAAVQIQSEHVARVTDVGTLESGAPYMVMEYLKGSDLGDVLRLRGPLPIAEAVGFLLQACEAIAEAHALGIVHRDLKPANMFLTQRRDGSPLVKVLDFGISKALQETSGGVSVTHTSAIMGSPLYMSPEQVRSSKTVDARSDVWALGVILQELLTGAPTYEAETASALMAMIAADPPTPLRQRRPDAPVPLEAAVLRCLEKDRERRTQNVAEFARAIAPFAAPEARASVERISRVLGERAHSTNTAPAISVPSSALGPTSATSGAWGQTQSRSRGSVGALVAIFTLLAMAAVGTAGIFWWRSRAAASATLEAHSAVAPNTVNSPSAAAVIAPPSVQTAAPAVTPSANDLAAPSRAGLEPNPASTSSTLNPLSAPNAAAKAKAKPSTSRPEPHHSAAHPDLFDDNK
jgi:eukaryotic-like serine/threonine-protein kinase